MNIQRHFKTGTFDELEISIEQKHYAHNEEEFLHVIEKFADFSYSSMKIIINDMEIKIESKSLDYPFLKLQNPWKITVEWKDERIEIEEDGDSYALFELVNSLTEKYT